MNLSPDLTPPDFDRCQCMIRDAHGPFVLGPPPRYKRCPNSPIWLVVEIIAGADGKHGAMTLCQTCCEKMMEDPDLRTRTQLQPILRKEPTT